MKKRHSSKRRSVTKIKPKSISKSKRRSVKRQSKTKRKSKSKGASKQKGGNYLQDIYDYPNLNFFKYLRDDSKSFEIFNLEKLNNVISSIDNETYIDNSKRQKMKEYLQDHLISSVQAVQAIQHKDYSLF